ncbi:SPI-1 type III secretion system needle tip complex protein SipD [Salmonella enterica subsp. enterica serovar Portland]|uniref:SPI-1 type III secretion system needle tip complex protein SipD n=2 Tax=Salmonella enterica TaxID=28901 RepID=UPI001076ED35|nr:type III secretion system needle tip protein SipD [Salmonella enterica]EBG5099493.1 SPI-1 type III secretion system needle tip complex protein SipD [Salmonella enterica subsp. enterica serovar India]EBG5294831.1 SPI-1 type III secretion system needle tip complex protein SipD [Salmonella enterica subsp. enterica]ECA8970494.1 type III secretion system needle tip protein SipD [Salmonella enterica subsp. enterica serovar Omuna]EDH5631487.1 type III secretion system needle tip protein SipD [Salmo
MLNIQNYSASPHPGIVAERPQTTPASDHVENTAAPSTTEPRGADIISLSQAATKAQQAQQTLRSTLPVSEENNDERTLARQQLTSSLNALAKSGISLSAEQHEGLRNAFSEPALALFSTAPMAQPRTTISDVDIWNMVSQNISAIGDNYLGVYENVVAVYTDFYQAFSDILSKMGGWLSPGKDGNTVKLNVNSLKSEISSLINKYNQTNKNTILFPSQTGSGVTTATRAEAEQWIKELNLPDSCLKVSGSGYVVLVDTGPLSKMVSDLNGIGSGSALELDNAKYQAWQAGFKAQEENLKTTLQTLTQKYSNANSLYDNLVKVLSSTISSSLETAKSFLQG